MAKNRQKKSYSLKNAKESVAQSDTSQNVRGTRWLFCVIDHDSQSRPINEFHFDLEKDEGGKKERTKKNEKATFDQANSDPASRSRTISRSGI